MLTRVRRPSGERLSCDLIIQWRVSHPPSRSIFSVAAAGRSDDPSTAALPRTRVRQVRHWAWCECGDCGAVHHSLAFA
jgi:hypothetical protein